MTTILGLDMSSTTIGYALADGTRYGDFRLDGDIAIRCEHAVWHVSRLLDYNKPVLVVIEEQVFYRGKKQNVDSFLQQAYVVGAVLAEFGRRKTLYVKITPSTAAKALTGTGKHQKGQRKKQMLLHAATRLGFTGTIVTRKGLLGLYDESTCILSEHAADAYGLALAGLDVRIITEGSSS